MKDFSFDITTRELILSSGDFTIAQDVSVQSGGILAFSEGFSTLYPTLGVGITELLNKNLLAVSPMLAMWKQQCLNDGAKVADYSIDTVNSGTVEQGVEITTQTNYP